MIAVPTTMGTTRMPQPDWMNSMNVSSEVRFVDEEVGRRAEPHLPIHELRYDGSVIASMQRPKMTDKGRSARIPCAVTERATPS
jgi:hypothetical protein